MGKEVFCHSCGQRVMSAAYISVMPAMIDSKLGVMTQRMAKDIVLCLPCASREVRGMVSRFSMTDVALSFLMALEAAATSTEPAERSDGPLHCSQCGTPGVTANCWVPVHKIEADWQDGPCDDLYCPSCDILGVEATLLKHAASRRGQQADA